MPRSGSTLLGSWRADADGIRMAADTTVRPGPALFGPRSDGEDRIHAVSAAQER